MVFWCPRVRLGKWFGLFGLALSIKFLYFSHLGNVFTQHEDRYCKEKRAFTCVRLKKAK